MENYMLEESINNDFLSQSYLQGVKRITGTNNFDPNLEIPKKILENNWEVREKTWNRLFDKYSEEPSSDIQFNIITRELEKEISDEEHSCGQQIRMYKPASLIQYWVNTGNPPYKMFLNEDEDIGSSLSEEESISLNEEKSISLSEEKSISLNEEKSISLSEEKSISLCEEENIASKQASFLLNKNNKQECRNNSSSSSVDTAAYILSNANITKKTDTMAIIEGAKCPNIKFSKNMNEVKAIANDKTECMKIARNDQCDYSGDNVNTNLPNTEIGPTEHVISKIHAQPSTISTNISQPNISQYSACEKTNKTNTLKSSPKQLDVRNIHDIASIFQEFGRTSQRLAENDKENITLDQIKVNRNTSDVKDEIEVNRNTSDVKQISTSIAMTETSKNNIIMMSQRKKLYTGRDSPIDLTLINRHNTNRLSQTNHSLHPALDTDCMITRETTFLSRKNKNNHLSFLDKKSLDLKKRIRKRKRSKFIKSSDSNSSIISSYQSLSNSHNNTQDDISFHKRTTIQENNDTNSFIKDGIYKPDLASLNLNPVVLLERITPSFKLKSSFVKNNHNMQENSVHNKHFVKMSRNLYDSESEDLQSRTSNTSSILISKRSKFIKNNSDSNSSIINSYQSLSSSHNNTQDDISFHKRITIQQNNDTNSFIKDGIYKPDLASLNLNPVVLLERITPSFKLKSSFVKNNHNMQENNVHKKHFVKTSRNLYDSESEDLQSRTSNTSSILISKRSKFIKNNSDSNSSIISSYQSLSSSHNNTQDDISFHKRITLQQNNDTNSFIKDGIYKPDLASLNLNPVVLLERITPSFKLKSSFVKNNHNMQENSVHNEYFVQTSRNLYDCENEDVQSTTSNTSILIIKCEENISQTEESSDSSFKLSIDDNNENIEKKTDKLSSSKDTIIIRTKEPHILIESLSLLSNKNINTTVTSQVLNKNDDIKQKEVLEKSQIHLYGTNKIGSLNVKEIKISQINKNCIDSMKSQILNKNDAIQQKEVLRESEACFSNSCKTNNKDNIKLQEVKVVLGRLPTNTCLKRSITDINLYSDKKKISQNTSLRNKINNKIKSPIDNNSLKMCIKSKKNDKLNDTSDIVSEHENQVSDKAKSNSANYKCSILSFTSSDEDDFVKLLQKRKRLKRSSKSINSKTLNKTNTVSNRNLNTVIFSSKEVTPKKIDNSIIENLNEQDKTVSSVVNINNNNNNNRRLDTVIKSDKVLKSSSTQSKSRYSNHINKERLFKGSTRNRYIMNFSTSSNSSTEHDITKQSHNMLLRSTSNEKAQVNKSLSNEEFNDISLRSNNNTNKNNKSLSFINDKQDTSVEKETLTSFGKNDLSNLSDNKQIPDKSKNSLAVQQKNSTTKFLRFQTKSYYDSDSSMSS